MSKLMNRGLYLSGEVRKVGTYNVHILEEGLGGVVRAYGTTVPADTDAGFAKGCYFYLSSGGSIGGTVYINEGSKTSADFNALNTVAGGGGGGADTLNSAYENGATITVDTGAVTLNDATTGALVTLQLNRTSTGSGHTIGLTSSAAYTGNFINIDTNGSTASQGIHIDCSAEVRTGADIKVTDNSTGNHSVIDINTSGSGNSVGFDYTDSELNGAGKVGALFTHDDGDGLSSTALKFSMGTGIRTTPVIDLNDASAGTGDIIDIDLTGLYEGNVIAFNTAGAAIGNVLYMDMTNAADMTCIKITDGATDRIQPYFEFSGTSTGTAIDLFSFTVGGVQTGNLIKVRATGAATGAMINIDLDAAVAAYGLFMDAGAGTRTQDMIELKFDGDGNTDCIEINHSATGSGRVFDINVAGAGSGPVLDVVYSAAHTGDAVVLDLTSGVGARALNMTLTGVRTANAVLITNTCSGNTHIFNIDEGSTSTGDIFHVAVGAAAWTGDALSIDLGATAVAASAIVLASGNMIRTNPLIKITDIGASTGPMFDINRTKNGSVVFDIDDATTLCTGNIFDYAASVASTGNILNLNMTNAVGAMVENVTLAGIRVVNAYTITNTSSGTTDIFQIDDGGTESGDVFDINCSTATTGSVMDVTCSGTKADGDIFKITMGTNFAGAVMIVNSGAGIRTEDFFAIDSLATGATHVFDINITGAGSGNVLDIAYSVGANTGNAILLTMGTNVAAAAVQITTEATGTNNIGSAINVSHTVGALAAGADVVRLYSESSLSSTSNVLSIVQATGAGTAGAYGLHINCGGANVEGLWVEAGKSVFVELVTVGSIADASATLTSTMIELNCVGDVSARLVAAGATETAAVTTHDSRIICLDTAAGSVVTLPAATGSGAVYKVIVSVLATSNSHKVQVTGTDVMYGMISMIDQDTAGTITAFVTAADSDTVTLNRSTTGSVTIGEWMEFVDVASAKWAVKGVLTNTGNGGTPFSAAV